MRQQLFTSERERRTGTTKALVPFDPALCPTCSAETLTERVTVDALLRHGGYGASLTSLRSHCPGCGWTLLREVSEERPPTF